MSDFIPVEDENYDPPSIKEVGHILFEYLGTGCGTWRYDVEVHDFTGGTFWIQEGVGWEYWFETHLEPSDLPEPGFYVVEGVKGSFIRGDGWMTDDDEEWNFDAVRRATQTEIEAKALA